MGEQHKDGGVGTHPPFSRDAPSSKIAFQVERQAKSPVLEDAE